MQEATNEEAFFVKWPDETEQIDLSERKISSLRDTVIIPQFVTDINLSRNALTEVPKALMVLVNLRILNLSHNKITNFSDCPNFYKSLERLDLSHNNLQSVPYWIWQNKAENLLHVNFSNNQCVFTIEDANFYNGLKFECYAQYVNLAKCNTKGEIDLMKLFPHAKEIVLGSNDLSRMYFSNNFLEEVPCRVLSQCHQLQRLVLCSTSIYNIRSDISIFQNLLDLNLSNNCLNDIPKEFCDLRQLEICILDGNNILYLPDEFILLKNLKKLYLSNNRLCMVPDGLLTLPKLIVLDLYNNNLENLIEDYSHLEEIDLAQNLLDEPVSSTYVEAKNRLRCNKVTQELDARNDGKKAVQIENEKHELSPAVSEKEFADKSDNSVGSPCVLKVIDAQNSKHDSFSSVEDWDSDSYFEPNMYVPRSPSPPRALWRQFVRQKVREGNFCPFLDHAIPINELIKGKIKPMVYDEGQCDSLTEDEDEGCDEVTRILNRRRKRKEKERRMYNFQN